MEDERKKECAPSFLENEIGEYEAAMSLVRLQTKPEKIKHRKDAADVFQDKIGEVNEEAMSDQVLCPAQLLHLAFNSPANPSSQAGVRMVRISPKQAQEANRPPYFEKLIGILGLGSGSSVIAAFNNFDKQALIAIHNKGLKNFTEVATGEYFCMHYSVEEESQILENRYRHLESAQELVPVHLRDLVIGSKCNECAVLYGELSVVPFKFGKNHTVMKEADSEDAVALSIVSSDPLSINQSLARKTYPKGMKIALKEPRLVKSKNGFIFIDVNNPLSIERIDSFQSPSNVTDTINARFEQWFGDGDRAHKEKDWNKCVRSYTKCQLYGLSTNTGYNQILKRGRFKLFSERCRAYIELQRYTEGLQDAEKCWQLEPSNTISNALKVESLVALGKYKAAYNFFQSCSKSLKQHNTAIFRQKCMEYYDIGDSISTGKLEIHLSEPDADFIGAVEIKMTENLCGRGMFATESIKAGEILLISKALAICDKYYSPFMFDPLENGLVQNVRNALSTKGDRVLQHFLSHDQENFKSIIPKMSEFLEEPQFAGGNCTYTLEKVSDNSKLRVLRGNVREIFKNISGIQVLNIIKRIAFDDRSPAVIEESTQLSNAVSSYSKNRSFFGVWLLPSFINHSCAPNASRINLGRDVMRVHATKDINRGEQITIPYFDVLVPCISRETKGWGFRCLCHRCEFERYIINTNVEGRSCFDGYVWAYHQTALSWLNAKHSLLKCYTYFYSSAVKPIDLESMSLLSTDVELFSNDNADDQESRCWIMSAFTLCYLAFLVEMMRESGREDPAEYEDDTGKAYRAIVKDLIEAIAGACPGDARYLVLCQKNVHSLTNLAAAAAKMGEDSENYRMYSYAVERAKKESKKACTCVYGQQKAHVAEAIMRKYSNKGIL